MFTALAYYGKFFDFRNWKYKRRYTFLTEPRLQCVVKKERKYQILSQEQKTGKE
jgi:hypothetical protein